ncbi:MAG: hypothetical protein JNK63_08820 [Chthonomonas sp.]|nr:hypothetical protein [Chthonomonas sp.]
MKDEAFKAKLRIWLMGFGVATLSAGLFMLQSGQSVLAALCLVFAAIEFFALWSLRK